MHTPCCSSFKTIITATDPACPPVFPEIFGLKRFQCFIETSDWDQMLIRKEKWVNRGCWFLVGLSLLYFCPSLAKLILP